MVSGKYNLALWFVLYRETHSMVHFASATLDLGPYAKMQSSFLHGVFWTDLSKRNRIHVYKFIRLIAIMDIFTVQSHTLSSSSAVSFFSYVYKRMGKVRIILVISNTVFLAAGSACTRFSILLCGFRDLHPQTGKKIRCQGKRKWSTVWRSASSLTFLLKRVVEVFCGAWLLSRGTVPKTRKASQHSGVAWGVLHWWHLSAWSASLLP